MTVFAGQKFRNSSARWFLWLWLRVSCAVTFRLAAAGTSRGTEQHEAARPLLLQCLQFSVWLLHMDYCGLLAACSLGHPSWQFQAPNTSVLREMSRSCMAFCSLALEATTWPSTAFCLGGSHEGLPTFKRKEHRLCHLIGEQ